MYFRMIISLTSLTPAIIAGTLTACGIKSEYRPRLPVTPSSPQNSQKTALIKGLVDSSISKTFVEEALMAINNPIRYRANTTSFKLQSSPFSHGYFCSEEQTPFDYLDVTSRMDEKQRLSFSIKTRCEGESIEQTLEEKKTGTQLGDSPFHIKVACQKNCTQSKEILHILMMNGESKILLTAKTAYMTPVRLNGDKKEDLSGLEQMFNRDSFAKVQIISNTVDFKPIGAKINVIFKDKGGQEQSLLFHAGYAGSYVAKDSRKVTDYIQFLKFSGIFAEDIEDAYLLNLIFTEQEGYSVLFLKSAILRLKIKGREDRVDFPLHLMDNIQVQSTQ